MSKDVAYDLAEKKADREKRAISIHFNEIRDTYHVTPENKAGDNVSDFEHIDTIRPEDNTGDEYDQMEVEDYTAIESGDRVVVNNDEMQTVTEITPLQIVTNLGYKFRKSDGYEWGGGENQLTHKLIKSQ